MNAYVQKVVDDVKREYPWQKEYIQAVEEVLDSISIIFDKHPEYEKMGVLERLVTPDRIISFKVPVEMDDGHVEVYHGYRVQQSNLNGPYKGGLRLNPTVNESIMKFLAFEQVFKNALTTCPMGGGKGGSNFNPKGKSEEEIKRFCYSFMKELHKYIGEGIDVPAGDIGVGAREITHFYNAFKEYDDRKDEEGFITGKPVAMGGSLARTEATGFGLVYFVEEILKRKPIENPRVVVSGSGNVAIYAAKKCQQLGWKVVGMSDSKGYILDEDLDVEEVRVLKEEKRTSLKEYSKGEYHEGSIYDTDLDVDIALPCATQNEINLERAKRLVKNGVKVVAEGANMPDDNEAIKYYKENGVIFAPGKAANAGGVATSYLEMEQNAAKVKWSFEEVDGKLNNIMKAVHKQCLDAINEYGLDEFDYVASANIAGATIVINEMINAK